MLLSDEQLKKCSICKETKPLAEFHNDRSGKFGKTNKCKVCGNTMKGRTKEGLEKAKQRSRNWHHANPDKAKNNALKRKFGITIDEYEIMHDVQRGLCAICGKQNELRKLAVDHDHVTGEIRALLCDSCNKGLGMFRDSEEIMTKAIEYIRSFKVAIIK